MTLNKLDGLHVTLDMTEDKTDLIRSRHQMDFKREIFPEDYEPEKYDVQASFEIKIEVKEKKRPSA